jgi:hypothetical protein
VKQVYAGGKGRARRRGEGEGGGRGGPLQRGSWSLPGLEAPLPVRPPAGDECVLAGGRRVVRRVEARIACSPDSSTYMLVREPDFCSYVFVVFTPSLCGLEYYKPRALSSKRAA